MNRASLQIKTQGKDTYDITRQVQEFVRQGDISEGICNLFIHHTSASLIIQENADPDVQHDLNAWMSRLVKDGDAIFKHREEGPDDMSAHIRSVLSATSLNIPVIDGRCALGTWQGIFLWEHRVAPHTRKITMSIW